jgi:TBC1 domain family protein 5
MPLSPFWSNSSNRADTLRFPDIPYFREQRVQSLLTTILYLHASRNPLVGYRQGMHELLAPLLYAVDFDSLDPTPSSLFNFSSDQVAELCDREWIAADKNLQHLSH